jgi:ribonuclease P protein component
MFTTVPAALLRIVAKKLARRAVWRNAVKRIGREAFRRALLELPPLDLILRLAKKVDGVDTLRRKAWRVEIDGLLAKLPK